MKSVETKTDIIKMENGKKDLPVGISQTKHGSYRLQRTIGGKDYRFGTIQNLELALRVNAGVEELSKDLKASLEKEGIVSISQVEDLIVKNRVLEVEEITDEIESLEEQLHSKTQFLVEQNTSLKHLLLKVLSQKKSFWQRITGR